MQLNECNSCRVLSLIGLRETGFRGVNGVDLRKLSHLQWEIGFPNKDVFRKKESSNPTVGYKKETQITESHRVKFIKSTSTNRLVMPTIEKLTSEKGKPMLGYGGYIYTLERTTDEKRIFRCHNRDCRGKWSYWIRIEFTL